MWVKQDISNTNNIQWSFLSTLSLIFKNQILSGDTNEKKIIIPEEFESSIARDQRIKALLDFESIKKNKTKFIESLDFKEDLTIFFKESNVNEQPPFLQNNEFRELFYN